MINPSSSILISTYNWPEALELVLESIERQVKKPDEIVIADDGSKPDTKQVIDLFQAKTSIPIKHIWHEDKGFRKTIILNKAINEITSEYIIQIDGDIILHKYFIKDHLQLAKQGKFITGSRVLLSEKASAEILKNKSLNTLNRIFSGKNKFNLLRAKFLRLLFADIYKQGKKNKYFARGCNMAFWKADLIKVNGYNEEITGWGSEDTELAVRLIKAGVRKRFLKMGGIAFHIHHKTASRNNEIENEKLLFETINKSDFFSPRGIDQYLSN